MMNYLFQKWQCVGRHPVNTLMPSLHVWAFIGVGGIEGQEGGCVRVCITVGRTWEWLRPWGKKYINSQILLLTHTRTYSPILRNTHPNTHLHTHIHAACWIYPNELENWSLENHLNEQSEMRLWPILSPGWQCFLQCRCGNVILPPKVTLYLFCLHLGWISLFYQLLLTETLESAGFPFNIRLRHDYLTKTQTQWSKCRLTIFFGGRFASCTWHLRTGLWYELCFRPCSWSSLMDTF